jgi:hypothetical protein
MKNMSVMGFMAASIWLTGCGKIGDATVARTKKELGTSQVIGYASANAGRTNNILLTVTQIWKSSKEVSRAGITNGMQFSEDWHHSDGNLPDGAVFLLSLDLNYKTSSDDIIWVRSGQVAGMTVQAFKAKIGL